MAVIWRRRNVLNWIVSMVVAGGPTPIWHQDILKRHGEIGQLYIHRYAILFQSWPVVSAALRKTATLLNARELRNLRNYVLQGRKVTIVTDHLDNAWFSAIATSSLSIEKKNTSPNGCYGCNVVTFFTWYYFTSFFFAFLWLHRRIVCNDCNAVYSRLMLFFVKRHRMLPVQFMTQYKPIPSSCFIKLNVCILDIHSHHRW